MSLIQTLALRIPAIRRLRDSRDQLLGERDELSRQNAGMRSAVSAVERALSGAEAKVAKLEKDLAAVPADRLPAAIDRDVELWRQAKVESRLILTDYGYHPRKRPIEDSAGGRALLARFRAEADRYGALMHRLRHHADRLLEIPRKETADPTSPYWENTWFPPFDAAALYGLIAELAPRRYVEVGSGHSTRFARRAITDLNLATRIVSIDPHPHTTIDLVCDEVVRTRMEDVPRDFWEEIGPDDLLFVDNSHRSFPNSDVTVFFTEVLPALKPGTVWGLHDIFLPSDYPAEWRDRFYNEQYLLMTYLLGGAGEDEILLPVQWVQGEPALHGILDRLWDRKDLFEVAGTGGGGFWMRRGGALSAGTGQVSA